MIGLYIFVLTIKKKLKRGYDRMFNNKSLKQATMSHSPIDNRVTRFTPSSNMKKIKYII